jgi:hypothetical protein
MAKRKKKPSQDERISLHPITLDQALRAALSVRLSDVKALETKERLKPRIKK